MINSQKNAKPLNWALPAILVTGLILALGFIAVGPFEPLTQILAVLGFVGAVIAIMGFKRAIENPFIPFILLFGMNILVYFLPKADFLAAGIALVTTLVFVVTRFDTVVKNRLVLSFLLFFIVNLLYWFFYSTDFIVGKIILYNGNFFNKESNNELAKSIVLYASLCPLIASITVVNVFNTQKQQVLNMLKSYYPYMLVGFALLSFLAAILKLKLDIAGQTLIIPMVFLFNAFYWLTYKKAGIKLSASVYTIAQVLLLAGLFLKSNKTTLIAVILILILYAFGTRHIFKTLGIRQKIQALFANPTITLMAGTGVLLVMALAISVGALDVIQEKLDYIYNGLTKGNTLNVRTSNWSYFFTDWKDKQSIINMIFGFGEGLSRETIFFISASRHSFPNNNNLVQTLHNAYLEYAYDFGLMATFYYLPTWLLLKKHVPAFLKHGYATCRLLSLNLILTIMLVSFYGFMDGIRIQVAIFYYLLLFLYDKLYDYFKTSDLDSFVMDNRVNTG